MALYSRHRSDTDLFVKLGVELEHKVGAVFRLCWEWYFKSGYQILYGTVGNLCRITFAIGKNVVNFQYWLIITTIHRFPKSDLDMGSECQWRQILDAAVVLHFFFVRRSCQLAWHMDTVL